MDALKSARATGKRIVLFATIFLAVIPPVVAVARGMPVLPYAGASVALVFLAILAMRGDGATSRAILSAALIGVVMLITASLAGHAWQVDSHMLYFAAMAGLITLVDVRALVLGAALVAAQHVTLSILMPSMIYPAADLVQNIMRAGIHGVILIAETTALIFSVWLRQTQMKQAQEDQDRVQGALERAETAMSRAEAVQDSQFTVVAALRAALDRLASRDLGARIEVAFPEDYEQLRVDYNGAMTELSQTVGDVAARASRLGGRAQEITRSFDDLSQRTEAQASTLQQTSSALDELTSSVQATASGAQEVEEFVGQAKAQARTSSDIVKSAVAAMTDIENGSSQISQIISVIDDIAFQTNLLALNAGVEAARAGAAGAGFAVVASEVRTLAQRSSEAAREIKELISGSSKQVENGATLVSQAGDALTAIAQRVDQISDLIAAITRGTVEQAEGLSAINTGVMSLDQVTQQNASMVEQSAAAARFLSGQASDLQTLMQRFELGADALDETPANALATMPASKVAAPVPAAATPLPRASGDDRMWQQF